MVEYIGLLAALVMGVLVYYSIRAAYSFAPWIPSKTSMVDRALDFIRPESDSRFVDLGCGDGRIVIHAARKYGLTSTGYEIAPLPYAIARLRTYLHRSRSISIQRRDLFEMPLASFDIVFVYGLPKALHERLEPKLNEELNPGTWVISYNFSLTSKKPLAEFHERWRNCYVYRY